MGKYDLIYAPTGLRRLDAAKHCSMSAGYFDKMVSVGVLPPPRLCGTIKRWLRQELDDAMFSLPTDGKTEEGDSCDAAFGM